MKYLLLFILTISLNATHIDPLGRQNFNFNFENLTMSRPTDEGGDHIGNAFGDFTVFNHESEHFKFWYTKQGVNAVPLADLDGNFVPDYIEIALEIAEDVWNFYFEQLNYKIPMLDGDIGGNSKIDLYFIDLSGADGYIGTDNCIATYQCYGFMVVENDFYRYNYPSKEYALKVLISHEFFHLVQNSYYSNGENWVFWTEGTAVLNEELFFPEQDDFENFLPSFFEESEVALNYRKSGGGLDNRTYGAALWAYWLTIKHGNDIIAQMWEEAETLSKLGKKFSIFEVFDNVLKKHSSSYKKEFVEFSIANLFTKNRAIDGYGYPDAKNYFMVKFENQNVTKKDGRLEYGKINNIKDTDYKYNYLSAMSANRYFKLNFYKNSDIVFSIIGKKEDIDNGEFVKKNNTISIVDTEGVVISQTDGDLEFSINANKDYYLVITDTRVSGRKLDVELTITEKPSCKNTKCRKYSSCVIEDDKPVCYCDDGFIDNDGICSPEVRTKKVDGCNYNSQNNFSIFFILFFMIIFFRKLRKKQD